MISILTIVLLVLLILVGKTRGIKTFGVFYLNLFLIIAYLFTVGLGFNAVLHAVILCIIVSATTLFGLNSTNIKTKTSFVSILIVLVITFGLVLFIGKSANIQGFSAESLEAIGGYSFDIGYDMTDILIGMFLITTIGTIIDTSISISSAVNEVYVNNPDLSQKELFRSGMNIGKDILATTINTLFFALVAEFIGFFMWHSKATLSYIINYKAFVVEVSKVLLCFISSILIIPITSYMISRNLINKKD